ncbi:sulfurtransferase [Mycolicibacterium chubuense]|uniref:Thiosulfate sulfurtransferase GlpE n=1 Tax=Mycolicibacterium chubuense TaxID=1800 RepID=A0A0J6WBQ7_MYCCU|nr:rhodanese-like domain-containing protein [Mycolicibacterium chubuense]KMO79388.1 Thiosulfate sulfurtransferase GlpE [Mycolicibacterium chubuense]ORA50673.1 sulfurtransferase [Mycolicibacterium chubuense]SPX99433.1 Rhodanese-related sulfurtransferase [Mycolicibacterium chubuense]
MPATPTELLVAHFAGKLAVETDASDVHADQENGVAFALVDARGTSAWDQGRIAGAVHMPTAEIAERATREIPRNVPVVTYCWGPGCNGSTRAALEFAKLGYQVKEMIGGFEYWAREGFPVETDRGQELRAKDPLTAPLDAATCDC